MLSFSPPIPSWLIEATNAMLLLVCAYMFYMSMEKIWRTWQALDGSLRTTYHAAKPFIAMAWFQCGVLLTVSCVWLWRFCTDHGLRFETLTIYATPLRLVGILMAVIGGVCWARVMEPTDTPHWRWFAIAAGIIAIGLASSFPWEAAFFLTPR